MKNIVWYLVFIIQFSFGQENFISNDSLNLYHLRGLGQNSIKSIVTDKNGMTWVSTELGLHRYDGQILKKVIDTKYPKIGFQRIPYLTIDVKTGLVYFLTYPENRMYKIVDGIIYKIGKKDLFYRTFFTMVNKFNIPNDEIVDKIKYYFKKNNYYLNKWDSQTIVTSSNTTYFCQKQIFLVFDKKGKMKKLQHSFSKTLRLLQFGKSVLVLDKGKAVLLNGANSSPKKITIAPKLAEKSFKKNSSYYIFGEANNYFFFTKGIIYSIRYDKYKLSITPLVHFDKVDLFTVHYNKKLKIYFFGTSTNGLFIAKLKQFHILSLNTDNKNSIYSIVKGNDNIWYSSTGWAFNKNNLKIKLDTSNLNQNFRFLLEYKRSIYYEEDNTFINIINKKKLHSLYLSDSKGYYPGTNYTYLKNQFWYSNVRNVFYLVKDTLVKDSFVSNKINNADIFQIKDFNENLLIATNIGVYKYKPFAKQIRSIIGLENKYCRYIKIIDRNSFWVGCYGDGLFLVRNNKAYQVTDKNINLVTAHVVEEDTKGNLWITTNDGLLVVNKKEALLKTLQNKSIECYRYTVEDGLLTNEFNGGCTHPSFRDTDGSLGFPTIKGVVWFYPEKTQQYVFSGKILIDQVSADGQTINLKNNVFSIPKETQLLSIDFSYPYYFNRENLSVEYRFAKDKKWIEIKGNNLKLPRVRFGKQILLMQIRTHGEKKYATQSFEFDFEARYYETFWFWILIGILFLLFLYVAYVLGLHIYNKREIKLNEIIEKKTAQLSMTVLELKYSKEFIEKSLIEKNILLKEVHHRVKNNLQLIISMLRIQAKRGNYNDINDFLKKGEFRISSMALIHEILYNNEEALDQINFQIYTENLVNTLNQTFNSSGDTIKTEVIVQNIILNLNTALPLGLIITELVTNAFKYAFQNNQSGKITITITPVDSKEFQLIVEDNGVGFNIDKLEKKSFGLELIRLLVYQLNGFMVFENSPTTKYTINFQQIF